MGKVGLTVDMRTGEIAQQLSVCLARKNPG